MNRWIKPMASRAVSALSVGVLVVGCGGGGGGGHVSTGVPHTNSSYAFLQSIGASKLSEPDAIALDKDGNIFVASYANVSTAILPKISQFTPAGVFVADFGNTGATTDGLLVGPQGIYVDGSGNRYVTDTETGGGQVVVYDSTNKFKQVLLAGQIGFPYQITGDPTTNLFVAISDLAEVIKFTPTGTTTTPIGFGTLNDPDGVAIDPATGNIYVSDYGNHDIVVFSSTGTVIKTFGNTGTYRLNGPQGITFNPTYGIFVADISNGYVYHYDTNGTFVETVGDSSGSGALLHPYDVTVASDGTLLVVDSGHNRVVQYKTTAKTAAKAAK